MTLPGGRAFPAWWRDLADFSPLRIWFAHLILHRVEVLVELSGTPMTTLAQALQSLLDQKTAPVNLTDVANKLTLSPEVIRSLLNHRSADDPSSKACHRQRRVFYFVDTRPPLYLPLPAQATTPLPPPSGWRFDLTTLEECLAQPLEWKVRHHFPTDISRLIRPRVDCLEADWQAVPIDRPDQSLLLLVETTTRQLLGFLVQPFGWTFSREPIFTLPADADLLASLTPPVAIESWRQAWQAWCQQRSLPGNEVEACKLDHVDHRLLVKGSPRFLERLRVSKSEALRGEAWVLAGTGRVRPAAQIELVS
jgi:hypothetical protein